MNWFEWWCWWFKAWRMGICWRHLREKEQQPYGFNKCPECRRESSAKIDESIRTEGARRKALIEQIRARRGRGGER